MTEFNFPTIFILLAMFQGLLLAVIIVQIKKENRSANIFVAILLLIGSLAIGGAFLYKSGLYKQIPYLTRLHEPFRFLLAPFLYLYVVALTSSKFYFKKKYLFHFIPFFIHTIILLPYYLKSNQYKIDFVQDMVINIVKKSFIIFEQVIWVLAIIQIMIYIFSINKQLKTYQENIKKAFSSIEKINLSWVKFIVNLFLIFCVAILILLILKLAFPNHFQQHFFAVVPLFVSAFIVIFVYKALTQPEVFKDIKILEELSTNIGSNRTVKKEETRKRYEKSSLTEQESQMFYDELIDYMKKEKPYLNQELTLPQLAENIEIPLRYLSQVINEKTGKNFYLFINSYRVEEVKNLLADSEKIKRYSILALAYDAGFNSKATFNAVFKQVTGMTPSQYMKSVLIRS